MSPFVPALLLTCVPLTASAVTDNATANERPLIWSAAASAQYQNLSDRNDVEIMSGRGTVLQFGGGYLGVNSYHLASLDIYAGPYEPVRNNRASLDFGGTGVTYQYGYALRAGGMRRTGGNIGLLASVAYFDVVGRSIGQNLEQREVTQTGDQGVDVLTSTRDYVVKVTSIVTIPAIFYADFVAARPRGNTPELLATRLEGYIVALGLALPAFGTHNTSYVRRYEDDRLEKVRERSRLKGMTLMLTVTGMLSP